MCTAADEELGIPLCTNGGVVDGHFRKLCVVKTEDESECD